MSVAQDSRYQALELAIRAFPNLTDAKGLVDVAEAFNYFLTAGGTRIPVDSSGIAGAGALETSEAEAAEPTKAAPAKAAAKPATKPATAQKLTGNVKIEAPVEPVVEAPAKAQPPKEEAPAKVETKDKGPDITAAQQAVVKLVTKIGREETIRFMQKTFGSPNVSGVDRTKHSYASIISTIVAKIKEMEQAAAA
jgi:hypothetical protein